MRYEKRNRKSGFALIDFTLGAIVIMVAFLGLSMLFYKDRSLLFPSYDAKHEARRYYTFAQAAIAYIDENLGQGQFNTPGEVEITCNDLTSNTDPATGQAYLSSSDDCYDSFHQQLVAYVDVAPPLNGGQYAVPTELLVFPQSYNDAWNNTMHWNNTGAKRMFYVNTALALSKLMPTANFGQTSGNGTYNPVTEPLKDTIPMNQLTPHGTVNITLDPEMNAGWFMYFPLYCEQTFVDLAEGKLQNVTQTLYYNANQFNTADMGTYTLDLSPYVDNPQIQNAQITITVAGGAGGDYIYTGGMVGSIGGFGGISTITIPVNTLISRFGSTTLSLYYVVGGQGESGTGGSPSGGGSSAGGGGASMVSAENWPHSGGTALVIAGGGGGASYTNGGAGGGNNNSGQNGQSIINSIPGIGGGYGAGGASGYIPGGPSNPNLVDICGGGGGGAYSISGAGSGGGTGGPGQNGNANSWSGLGGYGYQGGGAAAYWMPNGGYGTNNNYYGAPANYDNNGSTGGGFGGGGGGAYCGDAGGGGGYGGGGGGFHGPGAGGGGYCNTSLGQCSGQTGGNPQPYGWIQITISYQQSTALDPIVWGSQNQQHTSSQNLQLQFQPIYQQYFSPMCSYQQFLNLMYRQNPPHAVFHIEVAGAQGGSGGGYGGITAGTVTLQQVGAISGYESPSGYNFYLYIGQNNGGQSNGEASAIYLSSVNQQNIMLASAGGGGANGPNNNALGGAGGGNGQSGTSGTGVSAPCGTQIITAGGGGGAGAGLGGSAGNTQFAYANSTAKKYCSPYNIQPADNGNDASGYSIAIGNYLYTLGGAGYGSGGSGGEALCISATKTTQTICTPIPGGQSCTTKTKVTCSSSYVLGGAGGGGSYVAHGFQVDNNVGGTGKNNQPNGWAKLWLQIQ